MEGSKYFTREYNHHHNSPADLFYLQREAPSLSRTHRSSSLQMNQMLKDVFRGIEEDDSIIMKIYISISLTIPSP